MRNVKRSATPRSLHRYAARWRQELLAAITSGDAKREERLKRRYNKEDVRAALKKMYNGNCCYCEAPVGVVGADQIEHREPIEVNPTRAFDWTNLHLACAACNRTKWDRWDAGAPILDAVLDVPVSDHLEHESRQTGVWRGPLTRRGATTIDHAGLNRDELRESRVVVVLSALGVVGEINRRRAQNPADLQASHKQEQLEALYDLEYGSVVRWTVEQFLK